MKRKFSSQRLYNLVRIIVIVAMIIFVLAASWFTYSCKFLAPKCQEECMKMGKGTIYEGIGCPSCFNSCRDRSYAWVLAILTPTIFFGGVGLYCYLFPREKEEKRHWLENSDSGGDEVQA